MKYHNRNENVCHIQKIVGRRAYDKQGSILICDWFCLEKCFSFFVRSIEWFLGNGVCGRGREKRQGVNKRSWESFFLFTPVFRYSLRSWSLLAGTDGKWTTRKTRVNQKKPRFFFIYSCISMYLYIRNGTPHEACSREPWNEMHE